MPRPKRINEYAGFWLRLAAHILDCFILIALTVATSVVLFVLLIALVSLGILHAGEWIHVLFLVLFYLLSFIGHWLYYALMESSSRQATFGKQAVGLQVTDIDYQPISFGRATGRYFGKMLSVLIIWIGFFMIGITKRKQGLHDMISECLVVKRHVTTDIPTKKAHEKKILNKSAHVNKSSQIEEDNGGEMVLATLVLFVGFVVLVFVYHLGKNASESMNNDKPIPESYQQAPEWLGTE